MARASQIEIEISYRLRGESEWRKLQLSPQGYFGVDPQSADDSWDVDSPSQYTHSLEYLPERSRSAVEFVRHVAINPLTGSRQQRFYHVWGGGRSFSCHVHTRLPSRTDREELIVSNALPFEQQCSETLRFDLSSGQAQITMNVIGYGAGGDEHSINVLSQSE